MSEFKKMLIRAVRDYARNTLEGRCEDEGTGLLSGLVNLVDSVAEGSFRPEGTQADREQQIVQFLVAHDTNNRYEVS